MQNRKLKMFVFLASLLLGFYLLVPTVWPDRPQWALDFFPDRGARLGLDLQGGMYLVLEVEVERAVEDRTRRLRDEIVQAVAGVTAEIAGQGRVRVTASEAQRAALESWLGDRRDTLESSNVDGVLEVRYTSTELAQIRDWAVIQSERTIRNRIDQYGVVEPTIQRQGEDRIVVQLPGIDDPQRAIELIGKTAQLTFHLFRDDVQVPDLAAQVDALLVARPELKGNMRALNAAFAATLPAGVELRFQRVADGFAAQTVPVLVDAEPLLTGDTITDARVRLNPQYNEPYVALEFDSIGATAFEDVTSRYVGRRFAIVLDDTVYSAPVIRERIAGGRASIEGGFTVDEARDLAIVLRAGALPAPATILEERSVGPSLGQDSIKEGVLAISIGGFLVVLFMILYYKIGGLVADVALVANLVYLLALMSLFGSTLTLPGLAGIVLTIGMAVDGNIIIFERIREELRAGRSVRAAVDSGFAKALSAILDANVTTLIAGIVLFQFGTGPVRGFAVTLTVGVLTTMFSVLFVSRTMIDLYVQRRGISRLPI